MIVELDLFAVLNCNEFGCGSVLQSFLFNNDRNYKRVIKKHGKWILTHLHFQESERVCHFSFWKLYMSEGFFSWKHFEVARILAF